jgi:DNA-binding transcriptional ArsR family regulator
VKDPVSGVFAALGDPTRRGIYEKLLVEANGRNATEIARAAKVSRQAIVKHLQVLVKAGLASSQREGREVRYLAAEHGMSEATEWLARSSAAWDRRIDTLHRRASSRAREKS